MTWGLPLTVLFLSYQNHYLVKNIFPIMMLCFTASLFGWIWSIGAKLNLHLPDGVRLNSSRFKIIFAIPFIYLLTLDIWMGFLFSLSPSDISSNWWVIMFFIVLHFVAMGCTIYGIRFAAKTLKSIELGRMAHFQDYAVDFFLIWVSFVGYWFIQPRINGILTGNLSKVSSNGTDQSL